MTEKRRKYMKEYNRKYYLANREREIARSKVYNNQNRDVISIREKEYHELHRDRYREHKRKWYRKEYTTFEGRRRYIARNVRRKAMEKEAGVLTESIIKAIEQKNVIQYGFLTCEYCKMTIEETYHLEHKTPLSRGGTNRRINLCISCPQCNQSKGILTADEFRKKLRKVV